MALVNSLKAGVIPVTFDEAVIPGSFIQLRFIDDKPFEKSFFHKPVQAPDH
jgi:hypothetical protein